MTSSHFTDLARSGCRGRCSRALCGGWGVGGDGNVLAIWADAVLDIAVRVAVGQRLGGAAHGAMGQQQPEKGQQGSARQHGDGK